MATKTKPEPGSINIKFAQRLAYALRQMPENRARKLGTCVELEAIATKGLRQLVELAGKLAVDPRWLALGTGSRAGYAAVHQARRWKRQYDLPNRGAEIEPLLELLLTTPEPDRYPGTCRYCGCGDCEWVDPAHTICSTCLHEE